MSKILTVLIVAYISVRLVSSFCAYTQYPYTQYPCTLYNSYSPYTSPCSQYSPYLSYLSYSSYQYPVSFSYLTSPFTNIWWNYSPMSYSWISPMTTTVYDDIIY